MGGSIIKHTKIIPFVLFGFARRENGSRLDVLVVSSTPDPPHLHNWNTGAMFTHKQKRVLLKLLLSRYMFT